MKQNTWKKRFLVFFYAFVLLFSATQVKAVGLNDAFSKETLAPVAGKSYNTETSLNQIVSTIIQSVLSILGIIFLLLIIYGGITWMTAQGEESKVEKAQKIIRNAIIGLIITMSAYAISYFVINALSEKVLTS